MKKVIVVGIMACLISAFMQVGDAWSWGNINTSFDNSRHTTSDSNNSLGISGSRISTSTSTTSNSNNRTDNRRSDDSTKITDSYKSYDNRSFDSHAISDSYNTTAVGNDYSTGKRLSSHNIEGGARNSILGDFNQKVGADFSGGFPGSVGSSFDASTVNTQTFGDVTISGQKSE